MTQVRSTFPALNAGLTKIRQNKKERDEFDPPYEPGKGAFPMRRQPSRHAAKNPKGFAARRDMSRRLSRGNRGNR